MENYIFERTKENCDYVFSLMKTSDNEYYNEKARNWLKRHNVGRIRSTEVVHNKLIVVSHGIKGDKKRAKDNRGELNEINLDNGSVSTVFGFLPTLLQKDEMYF